MYWFKHHTNLRDSDAMKMILRCEGLEGVAIAYRLLEVGAQHCDDTNDFDSTIRLEGALCKDMLAFDVMGTLTIEGEQVMARGKHLEPYLDTFEGAKLIERGKVTLPGSNIVDGKRVQCPVTFETIRFIGLEKLIDEYTRKSRQKTEKAAKKAAKKS